MNAYNCKHFFPNPVAFIPLLVCGFGIYCLCNLKNPFLLNSKRVLATGICCALLGGAVFLSLVFSYFKEYKNVFLKYKRGNYQEIEGYVDDLKVASFLDSGADYFSVANVEFTLGADFGAGYKRPAAYGGVINKEGMYVNIKYIPYNDCLHIMSIDIFPEREKTVE